uniref:Uncharacterized protein n=1 Tax=Romanomermis culicivorax TaxID=13658 RepID=A0A915K7N7_ROMCU
MVKRLIHHGCRNNQLLDIFDLSIQKPVFCEENWQAFRGIVDLERGNDCGYGGIGGLCSLIFAGRCDKGASYQGWPVCGPLNRSPRQQLLLAKRVFCHCDKLVWAEFDAIPRIIDKEQQTVAVGDVDNCVFDWEFGGYTIG